jgi:sRNA-binding protein
MSINSDWRRGKQEARQAIELLRARWPNAFPTKPQEVRPLVSVTAELKAALGWSNAYAKGVLHAWKARESYCRAVLTYSRRIDLDGSLTEGVVDDNARAMATARLEQIAARKAKEVARPPATMPPLWPPLLLPGMNSLPVAAVVATISLRERLDAE